MALAEDCSELDKDGVEDEETALDDVWAADELLCRSSRRCSRPTLSKRLAVLSDMIWNRVYMFWQGW